MGIREKRVSKTKVPDRRTAEMKPTEKLGHRPHSAPPIYAEGRRSWIAYDLGDCAN